MSTLTLPPSHDTSRGSLAWLQRMHPDVRNLQPCYAERKSRMVTYRQRVDLMMTEVRAGKKVCAVFYGHPGIFAWSPHEAIEVARAEGLLAHMEPGISAEDCNDTYGHAMGDAVLKRTVAVCQQPLRPTDLFGRLGGEEFGILLHKCSCKHGMDIANRIRIAIAASPMEKDGFAVSISARVGMASTDTCGYELQRLCMEADASLYRAKRAGRNRVIADTELGSLSEVRPVAPCAPTSSRHRPGQAAASSVQRTGPREQQP